MPPPKVRVVRDPVHKDISLNEDAVSVIDTLEFQRLRSISQLATTEYVFPSATHTRFAHSLGSFHLAERLVGQLCEDPSGMLSSDDARLVPLAALVHDLGHPPFSHMLESAEIYACARDHEEWGRMILTDPDTEIGQVLRNRVGEQGLDRVLEILDGSAEPAFLGEIVSSQMDVDRFDYTLRDSMFTGANMGGFDVLRCLRGITIGNNGRLVIRHKSIAAFESHLVSRHHMYHQVYFHKINLLTQAYARRALIRARALLLADSITTSASMRAMLLDSELSVSGYLRLTDATVMEAFREWVDASDEILSTYCQRLLSRRGFHKRLRVPNLDDETLEHSLPWLRSLLAEQGLDPEHDLLVERVAKDGYVPYKARGITVEDGLDLADHSPIAAAIAGKTRTIMAFVPNEVLEEAERTVQMVKADLHNNSKP